MISPGSPLPFSMMAVRNWRRRSAGDEGHAVVDTHAPRGVHRRSRCRRATRRVGEGPGDRAAATPAAPVAAAITPAAAPLTLGEADVRRSGDQAQPADHRSAGTAGPRHPPRPAGDGAQVAPRARATQVDVPPPTSGRATADRRRGRGAAPAPGRRESALGLRPPPGRTGQARVSPRALDGPGCAEAAVRATGTAARSARRHLAAVPRAASRCRPRLRLLQRRDGRPQDGVWSCLTYTDTR